MNNRKTRRQIYSTRNLFVYQTRHSTYAVEGYINNKRIRKRFTSFEEAKGICHSLEEGSSTYNVVRTSLTTHQVKDAEMASHSLPDGYTLFDAVELLLKSHTSQRVPMSEAIDQHLRTKEAKSLETYKQAKRLLGGLSKFHPGTIQELTTEDATKFLASVSPGSFNHYLRACKGLYLWAERHEMVRANPFVHIKLRGRVRDAAGASVLSVTEARRLLEASKDLHDGDMLAYTCLCLFAGLRPESEVKRLTWDSVNLEDGEVRVVIGKTNTPRCVEMSENLVKWLRKCDQAKPIWPANYRRKWSDVRTSAGFSGGVNPEIDKGLKPYVKDYMRHTAISNRVRITGDIHGAATWAGNSPAMISRHYLGLVSSLDASKYWSL